MRSKAWLAAHVSLRLACLPRTASSAQRSRRLFSTCAAVPDLLAHAEVTINIIHFSIGPKLRYPTPAHGRQRCADLPYILMVFLYRLRIFSDSGFSNNRYAMRTFCESCVCSVVSIAFTTAIVLADFHYWLPMSCDCGCSHQRRPPQD